MYLQDNTDNMEPYYKQDYVTETVSRREDYGDPREETEVIIDENGASKTVTVCYC